MLRRFSVDEDVQSIQQVKSSVQRGIRANLIEQYPALEAVIDEILPKKEMQIAKCANNVQLIVHNKQPLFFSCDRDGPWYPTLRLLHRYPSIMPWLQVDKGAIPFVLNGSNIFCPGFTSKGGAIPQELEAGMPVAIRAEGKQHAMAIGRTLMSTADIRSVNRGNGVETVHFLLDGLWQTREVDK